MYQLLTFICISTSVINELYGKSYVQFCKTPAKLSMWLYQFVFLPEMNESSPCSTS